MQKLSNSKFVLMKAGLFIMMLSLLPEFSLMGAVAAVAGAFLPSFDYIAITGAVLTIIGLIPSFKIKGASLFTICAAVACLHPIFEIVLPLGVDIAFQYISLIAAIIAFFTAKSIEVEGNNAAAQTAATLGILSLAMMFDGTTSSIVSRIIAIVAVFMFYSRLNGFAANFDEIGQAAIKKLRTAILIVIIAMCVRIIPLIGLVAGILSLIAFILELLAYGKLKKSETFDAKGKSGANLIFISMIITIVGGAIGIIPMTGMITDFIYTVAMVVTVIGWSRIAESITTKAIEA